MPSEQQIEMSLEGWKAMPILFDIYDLDGSGTVSRDELISGMGRAITEHRFGVTLPAVKDIMRQVDLNDDNELDRMEFGCFLSRVANAAHVNIETVTSSLIRLKEKEAQAHVHSCELAWRDMPDLFKAWDFDGNGTIDRDELVLGVRNFIVNNEDVTTKLTLAECLALMFEVDVNGDKVLDKREFGAFVARFALSTGVPMDRVVSSLMEDCKAVRAKKQSAAAKKFGSMFAKLRVSMAEEEIIEENRPKINGTQRTMSARGA